MFPDSPSLERCGDPTLVTVEINRAGIARYENYFVPLCASCLREAFESPDVSLTVVMLNDHDDCGGPIKRLGWTGPEPTEDTDSPLRAMLKWFSL